MIPLMIVIGVCSIALMWMLHGLTEEIRRIADQDNCDCEDEQLGNDSGFEAWWAKEGKWYDPADKEKILKAWTAARE